MDGEIHNFIKTYGLSAEYLAKKAGVSRMTIYRWSRSKNRPHGNHYKKLDSFMKQYSTKHR